MTRYSLDTIRKEISYRSLQSLFLTFIPILVCSCSIFVTLPLKHPVVTPKDGSGFVAGGGPVPFYLEVDYNITGHIEPFFNANILGGEGGAIYNIGLGPKIWLARSREKGVGFFVWPDLLLLGGNGDLSEDEYSEPVEYSYSGIGLGGGLGFELHYRYIYFTPITLRLGGNYLTAQGSGYEPGYGEEYDISYGAQLGTFWRWGGAGLQFQLNYGIGATGGDLSIPFPVYLNGWLGFRF